MKNLKRKDILEGSLKEKVVMKNLKRKDILEARQRISSSVTLTPLSYSRNCSNLAGTQVFLKQENHQLTGSFKIRGAMNKVLSLSDQERCRGVITCSAGNHAQGVAYSATFMRIPSTVVMPVQTPLVKTTATQSYGADIILHGAAFYESYKLSQELSRKNKQIFIHPYEDPHVIAGQGTLGLEIMEQVEGLSSVVVPIGGGGAYFRYFYGHQGGQPQM